MLPPSNALVIESRAVARRDSLELSSPASPPPSPLARRLNRAARRAALAARQPRDIGVLVGSGGLALAAAIVGATAIAPWLWGLGAAWYAAVVGLHAVSPTRTLALYGPVGPPLETEVLPSEIAVPELRAAYVAILEEYERIRESLHEAEHPCNSLREPYMRSGDLVQLAGRIARTGNSLRSYLDARDPTQMAADVADLERKAAHASDYATARAYHQAAVDRARQQAACEAIERLYERVQARLTQIAASLDALGAVVIKLQAIDLEQIVLAGESVSQRLDVVRDDLQVIEASMHEALSGP